MVKYASYVGNRDDDTEVMVSSPIYPDGTNFFYVEGDVEDEVSEGDLLVIQETARQVRNVKYDWKYWEVVKDEKEEA